MENCGLHDAAAIIAETLLDQTTRALKQLNLRRNGISGEWVGVFRIIATSKWTMDSMDSTDPIDFWLCFWGAKHFSWEIVTSCSIHSSSSAEALLTLARCWMWCSNGQIWSSKWPRSFSTEPMKPEVPNALPGDLNEGDMRQRDCIILQKSEGLKVINLPNIMLRVSTQSIVLRNSDPQGISYPLEVWPCFMYHHVASPCASHVEANSDISKTENSDRHWFSDHIGAGKLMTWRHCKFREIICSPLSFAVQFCTNSFSNSSFYRNTTWGCFKIRDTQVVNRSSQTLDLGARKFRDTPGKLCFTTSPSYWDQFLSGLFASTNQTNQPANHQWSIHLEDQIEVSDLHHLMYANFIPTRWAPPYQLQMGWNNPIQMAL